MGGKSKSGGSKGSKASKGSKGSKSGGKTRKHHHHHHNHHLNHHGGHHKDQNAHAQSPDGTQHLAGSSNDDEENTEGFELLTSLGEYVLPEG